ncbi:MAG: hypothetical protein NUK54_10355 [Methanothrix sp.]|nr:hypothetical protein [Methanothrix sp.]
MRRFVLALGLLALVCLCLGAAAIASAKEDPGPEPPDWLSSGVGSITYYGSFGDPIGMEFYDDWLLHDEWYPVARSFLDGGAYWRYYDGYYGAYGHPIAWRYYDDRLFHDEWYPVARAFLDGTTYYGTYGLDRYHPVYIDGSWWRDPRGYRPIYRRGPGYVLGAPWYVLGSTVPPDAPPSYP